MRVMKLLITSLFILTLLGCSISQLKNLEYKGSDINNDFPVPANAESSKVNFENPQIKKGIKYSLKNIGGEQGLDLPKEYMEEIKEWGWEELEEDRMGSVYFFKRGETIISVEVHEDYIQLFELDV